ncbi:unnamed protein product [Phytomonas sp. EM1]|nr:unnamed protein product [Phytomonas sp. EM1]|eukprot:CCW64747.1 unnamed protein product [Phytomonas sp. isolate EM1]
MAYFPEAGFLNHSCTPNATYDILPEHVFKESEYFTPSNEQEEEEENENDKGFMQEDARGWIAEETNAKSSAAEKPETLSLERSSSDALHDGIPNPHERNSAAPSSSEKLSDPINNEGIDNENSRLPAFPSPSRQFAKDENATSGEEISSNALTEYGAPVYLFCCRATRRIEAGEEILISYVPPEWSFDNRQYVLHDRYRFWCKCPKCSPTLDKKYARIPKFVVGLVMFTIVVQMILVSKRDSMNLGDDDNNAEKELEWWRQLSEEEKEELQRTHGMKVEEIEKRVRQARQKEKAQGFFEWMEKRRMEDVNKFDGQIVNSKFIEEHDLYARKR